MIKYFVIIAAILAGIYLLSSCLKDNEGFSPEDNLKKGLEYLEANGQREGVITTPSGLQYELLEGGKNDEAKSPKATDMVRCHYKGTFIDGKIFDSSYGGNPIVFPLDGVIPGWTEGLQYMKEGDKYRFVIPYQLAYGPSGYATIPPYSTLIFEVELIEVL